MGARRTESTRRTGADAAIGSESASYWSAPCGGERKNCGGAASRDPTGIYHFARLRGQGATPAPPRAKDRPGSDAFAGQSVAIPSTTDRTAAADDGNPKLRGSLQELVERIFTAEVKPPSEVLRVCFEQRLIF